MGFVRGVPHTQAHLLDLIRTTVQPAICADQFLQRSAGAKWLAQFLGQSAPDQDWLAGWLRALASSLRKMCGPPCCTRTALTDHATDHPGDLLCRLINPLRALHCRVALTARRDNVLPA